MFLALFLWKSYGDVLARWHNKPYYDVFYDKQSQYEFYFGFIIFITYALQKLLPTL